MSRRRVAARIDEQIGADHGQVGGVRMRGAEAVGAGSSAREWSPAACQA